MQEGDIAIIIKKDLTASIFTTKDSEADLESSQSFMVAMTLADVISNKLLMEQVVKLCKIHREKDIYDMEEPSEDSFYIDSSRAMQ